MLYSDSYFSPLGELILISDDNSLKALSFSSNKYYQKIIPQNRLSNPNLEILQKTKNWLDLYFNNKNPTLDNLILTPDGTVFQKAVWSELIKIPFGQTSTYGHITTNIQTTLAKKNLSAQAVGQAIGRNPISIIIPCHRILNAKLQLTGYAGGINLKKKLLDFEGALYKN